MRRIVRFKDFFLQVAVVGLFIFILVALYPTDSFFEKDVKAIYSIDVNPGIILMVDEDEKVLHLEGVDAESQIGSVTINRTEKKRSC